MSFHHPQPKGEFTTPYGKLPKYAFDINGHLYEFDHVFFLNEYGQGFKLEKVFRLADRGQDVKEALEDWELEEKEITQVNMVMSDENNRYVSITEEEYQMIESYIKRIESGEIVK